MFDIKNADKLKFAYEYLRYYEKEYPNNKNRINDIKKEIRRYLRESSTEQPKIIKQDYDSYTVLIPVPTDKVDYISEWFEREIRLECFPSQYDCTGQQFTISYHFVHFRGKWYCVHDVGIDV